MFRLPVSLYPLLAFIVACTPPGLSYKQLAPQPAPSVVLLSDAYKEYDSSSAVPPGAEFIALIGTDSVYGGFALTEYDDIIVLQLHIYNSSSAPYRFDPAEIVLLDGNRAVLKMLEPHAAANVYASRVASVAPYQPKYNYTANTTSSGYATGYGNSAYYSGSSRTTVTAQEDPYHALGYQLGAAFTQGRNEKYQSMANAVYNAGITNGWEAPSSASNSGALYWLKRPNLPMPLVVRFVRTGYEVTFERSR